MGKIVQLDHALSNKIAAGEVVERPASVVKELTENAIDAGSTMIEIHLEEAGLASIRIIDNGHGIEEDDVLTAFQRHATSKIKNEQDLFRIRTLGFRGEALPSIASVSRLELRTSTGEGPGTRVFFEGGELKEHEGYSSRKGTDITVADLFFNTPARLKYMKSIHTELGNITDCVNRLALSNPNISFKLINNEKKLLHTNGNGDIRQVLAAIYGLGIAKSMVPISGQSLDFKVTGYAALPEVTRASRNYISTMINGRFIKNYALAKAIMEGYHTLLPIGRYPIAILSIEMDPLLVDVNVHPSKMEVRLSKEAELFQLVDESIKAAFKTRELIPSNTPVKKKEKDESEQTQFVFETAPAPLQASVTPAASTEENRQPLWREPVVRIEEPIETPDTKTDYKPFINSVVNSGNESQEEYRVPSYQDVFKGDTDVFQDDQMTPQQEEPASRVPVMYPIGQMHGTYILAQNEKGLYIIDQHAAQERIKYEYFREKVGKVASELQEMLIPITLEFSTDEVIRIQENMGELESVGVFLEDFGYNSFIVRSHPQWFPKGLEQEIIEEMIQQVLNVRKVNIKKLREEAAILMSCKGSIKANHYLRQEDMQALLDELRRSSDPFTCPHGRPIIIHYSTYEMEKMFKRVM
ncbi:DNA mismatch repair endonuclease MutL [Peribacillus deserti]|uniref:DNA mismatch repair protein MutL n=1 Tax=Peribacillus deserti TaxID=673318 RepID=A0A2N5MBC9_9BACI|nr:DNA mismatch repair endonuclease MutL [Peribacillus deserti]PLT31654.1 DNA mismatch repair endonuclease MutL [Peribacillus deserti]